MNHSPHGVAGLTHQLRRHLTPTPFTTGTIQWGTVHAVHTQPRSVDLLLDGITKSSSYTASHPTPCLTKKVRYLRSYTPTVGDVVLVLRGTGGLKTDRIVLGTIASATAHGVPVTLTDIEALFTAKGQLLMGTGAGTGELLAKGSTGYVFVSGSTIPYWATPAAVMQSGFTVAWTNATYATGWTSYTTSAYNQAQYRKIGNVVYLRGAVKRTSGSSSLIFTLPSGDRPAKRVLLPTFTNAGAFGSIFVYSTGEVALESGSATQVFLTPVSFSTN